MRHFIKGLVAATAIGVAAPAFAQDNTPAPAALTQELGGGWVLDPVVLNGEVLVGYLAQLPQGNVGANVTLLWLSHNGDGTWTMSGWKSAAVAEAVADIRTFYSDFTMLRHVSPVAAGHSTDQFGDDCVEPVDAVHMPYGLLPDDPNADTAHKLDKETMAALIAAGAAGAPELSPLLVSPTECGVSEMDILLDALAIQATELLDIQPFEESMAGDQNAATLANCMAICIPWSWTTWGAWGAWTCTGGPTPIAGACGSGGCRYTGCTRTRAGTRSSRSWNCTVTTTPVTGTQGPQNKTCPQVPPGSGNCPASPPAGC